MNNQHLSRFAGWLLLASAYAATPYLACAQDGPATQLDAFVVSATRTTQNPQFTPSSVTLAPLADLQAAQIDDLRTALAQTPGITIVNSGAAGSQSSVFLRGASSHQTLFVVDGVRMNDRSAAYFNFLGSADLSGLGRLEVLRGPQSTLYGSSAMGGVILLETAHGNGQPSGTLSASGGAFQTCAGALTSQGRVADLSWSAAVARAVTANDRPNNNYKQWNYSTRLEMQATPTLLVGATLRGVQGDQEEPGSLLYVSPGRMNANNSLVTAYGQWNSDDVFVSRLTTARHQRKLEWRDAWGASRTRNTRDILDWQNTWMPKPQIEVVGGVNAERSHYTINDESTNDDSTAEYLSATFKPIASVILTGGLRHDEFDSAGGATTGRAGVAWLPWPGTKLRSTYGTGFSAPGSDDRFGVTQWGQLANPSIRPEKSRGWDAGIEQTFAKGRVTLSATYFHNKFSDLFEYEIANYMTYEGRIVNRAQATTQGAEFTCDARLTQKVSLRTSYTYLHALDDASGARLQRRPRHTGDLDLRAQVTRAWLLGAGLHFVADRIDGSVFDYNTFTSKPHPFGGWTTARLYASFVVSDAVQFKIRIENVFDKAYEETWGYPALPRGVFGSVEWKF